MQQKHFVLCGGIALILAICCSQLAFSQNTAEVASRNATDPLTREIREALEQGADSLSPLTVKWVRSRKPSKDPVEVLALLGYKPMNIGILAPEEVDFSWKDGRYHSLVTRRSAKVISTKPIEVDLKAPLEIVQDEASFDGAIAYTGSGVDPQRKSRPLLRKAPIEKLARDEPNSAQISADYLLYAGFVIPGKASAYQDAVQSIVLSLISEGSRVNVTQDTLDGDTMTVVTLVAPAGTHRFFLDPRRGFALRRRVDEAPNGKVCLVSDCSDFVQMPEKRLWLPRRIRNRWTSWNGRPELLTDQPLVDEEFQLSKWSSAEIPDSRFVLQYDTVGSYIVDATVDGAEVFEKGYVTYRIPANPKELDDVIASSIRDKSLTVNVAMRRRWVLWANVSGAIVALIAFGVYYSRRRSH